MHTTSVSFVKRSQAHPDLHVSNDNKEKTVHDTDTLGLKSLHQILKYARNRPAAVHLKENWLDSFCST